MAQKIYRVCSRLRPHGRAVNIWSVLSPEEMGLLDRGGAEIKATWEHASIASCQEAPTHTVAPKALSGLDGQLSMKRRMHSSPVGLSDLEIVQVGELSRIPQTISPTTPAT